MPSDVFSLEEFLPYRLSILSNTVSGTIAKVYAAKFDMNIPQWRVMAVLAEYPGISADEVCVKTEIDKATISRAVATLLKRGNLERKFAAEDRRRSILQLSRKGRRVYDEVIPLARDYERRLLSVFNKQERTALGGLLNKLMGQARSLQTAFD